MNFRRKALHRYRGPALALAVSAGAIALHWYSGEDTERQYHRSNLPGYDAWVYVAMADYPAFFTLPPWGYRLLTPWVVHQLPMRRPRGFRYVSLTALVMTGFLFFPYLRRLGHGEAACLVAIAAFGLSPPVGVCLDNYFLAEPMTLLLVVAFLLGVEAGCNVWLLSLLALLGALSKEVMLPLLPVVWLARRDHEGDRRALKEAALVSAPVLLLSITLRLWWTPYLKGSLLQLDIDYVPELLGYVQRTWPVWLRVMMVGGLMPLAALGALRKAARPFLRRYGYVLALSLLLPFVNPSRLPFSLNYLAREYSRFLIYAMPSILPLCLLAIDRLWSHLQPPPTRQPPRRVVGPLAACGVIVLLVSPFVVTDRYRRYQPRERQGYLMRIFVRQSLRTATRLERGKTVKWTLRVDVPAEGTPFAPPPRAIRWFLGEGWGSSRDAYGEEVRWAGAEAALVLPTFKAQDIDITLRLRASRKTLVHAYVNGVHAGAALVGSKTEAYSFRTRTRDLFRGDNLITLWKAKRDLAVVFLRSVTLHPVRAIPLGGAGALTAR